MESIHLKFSRAVIILLVLMMLPVSILSLDITTILDLWNVRDNLGATYNLLNDLNLEATNPASLNNYQNNTDYEVGNIVKYIDGYAYYCTTAHNSGTAFISGNWTKMWEAIKGWKPIGNSTTPFYGRFNGNHHNIYNLYIDRKASPVANTVYPSDGEDFVGLFGLVSNGSNQTSSSGTNYNVYIKDLGLLNPNVSGRRATGSLVGRVYLPYTSPTRTHIAYIENCFAKPNGVEGTAVVNGFGSTGGLVGANNSDRKQRIPIIRFSYANVTVSATHPNNTAANPFDEIEEAYFNPYNIKYGGLVGCNENGTTQDSYAYGNVTGGDRVGGLAGCSIGGAIFRSYATGQVVRNISPGNYQGGIGGIVGVSSGYLPPALGGTNAYGSVEDSYWDTTSSGYNTSAGGTGMPTANFSSEANFNNWDFNSVWTITASYPTLQNSPLTNFHFRTKESGNFSSSSLWDYSQNLSNWISAVTYPDHTNANSITISSNNNVTLNNDWYITNTTIQNNAKITIPQGDTLFIENSDGDDLIIQGDLDISGNLIIGQSASIRGETGSKISFLGNSNFIYTSGVSSLYDVEVNNPNGVTFSQSLTINGTLIETNGQLTHSSSTSISGLNSSDVRYLDISSGAFSIDNFSVSTTAYDNYPLYVKREWNIQGSVNSVLDSDRQREITFYWNATEDENHDWQTTGDQPILYLGSTAFTANSYNITSNPREATYTVEFPQSNKGEKATYRIGIGEDETLPVTLSSFTAQVYQTGKVQIIWTTQSESSIIGYTILKSNNVDLDSALNIGFVESQNYSQTHTYKFLDEAINSSGEYYYWLMSSGYDGYNQVFGAVRVEVNIEETGDTIEIPEVQGITSIYPNPFNPSTTIDYYLNNDENVLIEIYNIKGQRIKEFNLGRQSKGNHTLVWNAMDNNNKNLPSGIYFTKMNIGNKSYLEKMILMK